MKSALSRALVAVASLSVIGLPALAAAPAQAVGPQGLSIEYSGRFIGPDPNSNHVSAGQWVHETVTVTWVCRWEDGTTYDITKEVATEGEDQAVTATCEQPDGNSVSDTQRGINIDETAPEVDFLGRTSSNAAGWNKGPVTVRWTCTDDLSGTESDTVSTTLKKDGPDQTATGTCRDLAGNTASADRGNINIDTVAPDAEMTDRTQANDAGWNNTPVAVTWTCLDEQSGPAYDETSASVTKDGEDGLAVGVCKDKAGNVFKPSEPVKLDTVAPTTTLTSRTPATVAGWNNGDVDLQWTCTDATSGPANAGDDATLTAEGGHQSATGECTDVAGNSSSNTVDDVNIDLTAPGVEWTGGPADGSSYYFGLAPKPTCFTADLLSGAGTCTVDDDSTTVGPHVLTATATDLAGNTGTDTRSYTVKKWRADGFIGAVTAKKVARQSKQTLSYSVFAGDKRLTSPSLVGASFFQRRISCVTHQPIVPKADDLGLSSTYNAKTRAFNATWRAPSTAGCYAVRAVLADSSALYTSFQVR